MDPYHQHRMQSFLDGDSSTPGYGRPRYPTTQRQPSNLTSFESPARTHHSTQTSRSGWDTPTASWNSSQSARRRDSTSSAESRSTARSSVDSAAGPMPWQMQPYNLPLNSIQYNYTLPCECGFTGCEVDFNPRDVEAWILHSISHFHHAGLPPKSVCTICDREFGNQSDPDRSWRERMVHISGHFVNHGPQIFLRPDFWVIKHLRAAGLMSIEDFQGAMSYTERPPCENLVVQRDIQTNEMKMKSERAMEQRHDLDKERRQRRREGHR